MPDAKPAVRVILRIMRDESPVIREPFAAVLRQIDPERFDIARSAAMGTVAVPFFGFAYIIGEVATRFTSAIAEKDGDQRHIRMPQSLEVDIASRGSYLNQE